MGGWLCGGKGLFGQNQFAVAGDAEPVFVALVVDDDFVPFGEQLFAADPEPAAAVFAVRRRPGIINFRFVQWVGHK